MSQRIVRSVTAALLGTFVTITAATPASAQHACEPFTLTGTHKAISLLDRGPPGDSPGDRRIVMTALIDEAGEEIAINNVVATLVGVGEHDGDTRFSARFDIVFHDGQMAGAAVYERPNDDAPNPVPITVIIHDGTGVFAGAQGWIEIGTEDDPTYVFNIFCE